MLMLHFLFYSFVTSIPAFSAAKLLLSPTELTKSQYDFVVIGAGTAGNVLASRLTEDPNVNVLLIEAGGSNEEILNTIVPFLGVILPGTPVDWNFTSTPQVGLNNRTISYPRGHVLGGSSTINGMTWNRGSNDVWNNWANLTDDPGWSWKSVEKYYLKTSRLVPPADNHNTTGQVNPAVHGNGPVEVSVPGFPTDIDDRVINTSKQLGGRFIFNEDLNAGDFVGFSFLQSSIGNGERSSSATAYLEPVESRDNLDILITTQVTRLIQSATDGSVPVFKTVELAQNATSRSHKVNATKEVILCTGVIGTPQILLRSGIGPKNALQDLGIHHLVDLPDVGENLADHPVLANYFLVNSNNTFDIVLRNFTIFGQELAQWNKTHQGLFVDTPGNTQGFMRLPEASPIFKSLENPAAGPLSGNTEIIPVDGFAQFGYLVQPATGNFLTMITAVTSPVSRGSVRLASSDPFAKPLIDPAFLTSEFDVVAMVQAMKDAQEFIKASPWRGFVIGPFGDLASANTDEAKAAFARNVSISLNHPVGTARMSPAKAKWGVVDPDLLVKGASGLRVVDASIFPVIPECHPQALVYTVAERAADLIKTAHGIS